MTKPSTHIPFDTLAYSNKLKQAGMDAKLAEVQTEMNAQILQSIMEDQVVTKKDILDLRTEAKNQIIEIRQETKADLHQLDKKLSEKIAESGWRVILILGSIQALVLGILSYVKY